MKKYALLILSAIFASSFAMAASYTKIIPSLSEADANINVSSVRGSSLLGKNDSKDLQLHAVTVYQGQSTDVSPKYKVYLTYYNGGEMNNTRTAFLISKEFWEIPKTTRLSAGIYQIEGKVLDLNPPQLFSKAKIVINTYEIFRSDRNLKPADFEDPYFKSTIKATSNVKGILE